MNRITTQDGVQIVWISFRRSFSRKLSAILTDCRPFHALFNCVSVAISRLFCRYPWSVSALVLHSLACFLLRGEISVSSYPKHIPAVLSSFLSFQSSYQSCPIISWSAVFQSSYISYFWIPSIPIFVPFLVLSGLSYFGKSILVLYFSVQMMTLVLWTLLSLDHTYPDQMMYWWIFVSNPSACRDVLIYLTPTMCKSWRKRVKMILEKSYK